MVGLNECLYNLTGETLAAQTELGINIIKHMLDRIDEFSKNDGIAYTFEQTPAESTAHRFAMLDKSRFPKKAYVQGSDDIAYYTNSTHVPYHSDIPLTDKIKIEAEFHPYFTGGLQVIMAAQATGILGNRKNMRIERGTLYEKNCNYRRKRGL